MCVREEDGEPGQGVVAGRLRSNVPQIDETLIRRHRLFLWQRAAVACMRGCWESGHQTAGGPSLTAKLPDMRSQEISS